jgi:hypothetical protein
MMIYTVNKLMKSGISSITFFLLIVTCLGLLFTSCNNDNPFTIGEDFIESETNLSVIDTLSVEMSTVIQDSIPTSGTGNMLLGNFHDTLFGDASCSAYFQLGVPEYVNLGDDDIYDSISLIICYSGYYYGDTNSMMQINIHRVTQDIETNENGYLYNTSTFAHDPDVLGSVRFYPSPSARDTIEIKLSNDLGLDLFNKFVQGADEVQSDDYFTDYFKGIALLPNGSSDKAIIGFKDSTGYLKMRLYTHRIQQTEVETPYDFPIINTEKQFNHIDFDFTGTLLHYTQDEGISIPSSAVGNQAFVQGYKKIMTKLRFPGLSNIVMNPKGIIMKAELVFQPVKTSYDDFSLPDFVIMYETNRKNQPVNLLYTSDNNVRTATLVVDDMYHEETSYTYDLTDFITNELADSYFDVDHGLLISLYDNSYQLNFERIVISAKNPAPKLKLYYLTY